MKDLFIEAGDRTPRVDFYFEKGTLSISGRSQPEDVIGFYEPLLDLLKQCVLKLDFKLVCDIKLEYFNTASAKKMLDLFKACPNVIVNWHYADDDEDMQGAGEHYKEILEDKAIFNFIEYKGE